MRNVIVPVNVKRGKAVFKGDLNMKYRCNKCGTEFEAGLSVRCPKCGESSNVEPVRRQYTKPAR